MAKPIRVGSMLYGYCGGAFGRMEYGPNRVEAIGADWVVARNAQGEPVFAPDAPEVLEEYTELKEGYQEAWNGSR